MYSVSNDSKHGKSEGDILFPPSTKDWDLRSKLSELIDDDELDENPKIQPSEIKSDETQPSEKKPDEIQPGTLFEKIAVDPIQPKEGNLKMLLREEDTPPATEYNTLNEGDVDAMAVELQSQKILALQKQAEEDGVGAYEIKAAIDSDDPVAKLVALINKRRKAVVSTEPVSVISPTEAIEFKKKYIERLVPFREKFDLPFSDPSFQIKIAETKYNPETWKQEADKKNEILKNFVSEKIKLYQSKIKKLLKIKKGEIEQFNPIDLYLDDYFADSSKYVSTPILGGSNIYNKSKRRYKSKRRNKSKRLSKRRSKSIKRKNKSKRK